MLKSTIKYFFRIFGLKISHINPTESSEDRFTAMLKHHGVNCVFDVGANVGQFAHVLRGTGYQGQIVSFEPMSAAYSKLLKASQNDNLWTIAPQIAIGNYDGQVVINISGNSVSSSALKMLDSHALAAPESVYVGSESVPICRLDVIGTKFVSNDEVLFIKIDTQGYEEQVLEGAQELLKKAVGLQLELSLIPLYDGQALYQEMVMKLKSLGFELWGISPAFTEPISGRLLQVDATFFRANL
jgi:FkbM family methyltransferase